MRRDVLFLCQYFYPDNNSSATLPFDTARYLARSGLTVDALVGYAKEYSSELEVPLNESVEGVSIRRIKYIQASRVGKIGRLINYFSFTFKAFLNVGQLRNCKLVVVYSNPPILPIVPTIAKKRYGTKFMFIAYDIYPEIAYASKSLKPASTISRVMMAINKRLYSSADMIVSLTDEMKEFILANRKGIAADRITTIANWAHEGALQSDSKAYESFGYKEDDFIVSYFGNMGTCQDMDTIIDAAETIKDDDSVKFLIVGHGNKKESVEKRVSEKELRNVQVIGFLTGDEFGQAVAISSCYLVSLERGLKGTCAPSKYYSYLQGGKPILAIVEADSYISNEIAKESIGYAVRNGDSVALVNAINKLQSDQKMYDMMGERAKELYDREYSYEVAMSRYERLVKKLLQS